MALAMAAPLQGVQAHEPQKQGASKAKKKPVSKKRASTRKRVSAKKRSTAKKSVSARKRSAAKPKLVDGKPLLKSSVAYVVDQESGEVLLGKNDDAVRPIASLTKLMTGIIIADAGLKMNERIRITSADVDRLKNSSSRLRVGTRLTRRQALHLALMSSENRAAHALARTYPGGEKAFVAAMNNMARKLGMEHTRYVDPTGLSSRNQSSARDLALVVAAAAKRPLLRKYTTSRGYQLAAGKRRLRYVNTNRLVREGKWDIALSKTGYIREAGQCLVMKAELAGRELIMVFLDSASKVSRVADAERVRRWLKANPEVLQQAATKGDDNG